MKRLSITIGTLVIASCLTLAFAQDSAVRGTAHPQLRAAEDAIMKAEAQVQQCQQELEKRRESLFSLSGLVSVTPEALRQLAERLQDQKEALQVDEAGAKGRQDAIAKAIADTTDRLKVRASADDVTAELEKVVSARQKQLERIRQLQAAAAVPNADVVAAEAALATARAEAAASRQKTAGLSSDLLEALNRELINLTIGRQERAAKMEYIEGV